VRARSYFSSGGLNLSARTSFEVARGAVLGIVIGDSICAGCVGPFACHRAAPCGKVVGECGCDFAVCDSAPCDTDQSDADQHKLDCADDDSQSADCDQPCSPAGGGCAIPSACGYAETATSLACGCTSGAWSYAEPAVCWPWQKFVHVLNFCAPDGFVGPPDQIGPGRFHPVPTRPVFTPQGP
jgi:hypothetical protein